MGEEIKYYKKDKPVVKIRKIITYIFLLIFIYSSLYSLYKYFTTAEGSAGNLKNSYFTLFLQCASGFILILLPLKIKSKYKMEFGEKTLILYFIFIFMAIFLANFMKFYIKFEFWDGILHFISGIVLTLFGFILARYFLGKGYSKVSPFFIGLFALSFAIFCGVIWEIYEYTGDGLTGSNMQKYMSYEGEIKIGRDALVDTMSDIILAFTSSFFTSLFGYKKIKDINNKKD